MNAGPRELRAGPVTALLDGVDLRRLRIGSIEMIRAIYVAVRDGDWRTIPGTITDKDVTVRTDRFRVSFAMRHRDHDLDFAWAGEIVGGPSGEISYSMNGTARNAFDYNRIGFCVLHPIRECAGRPFSATTPDGTMVGHLPDLIAPQPYVDGRYVALFSACSGLTIALTKGASVECSFEGDLFEMEDQRNWTDASFKTYCTPMSLGVPFGVKPGDARRQRVTVRSRRGNEELASPPTATAPVVTVGDAATGALPALGHALPAGSLTARELAVVRKLRPAYLRAELRLAAPDWPRALADVAGVCEAVATELELVLLVGDEPLADVAAALASLRPPLARILVFHADLRTAQPTETTSPALGRAARQAFGELGVPVGGGTLMNFCELNRTRPDPTVLQVVSWPLVAQVHASDELSMIETLEGQIDTVRTARRFLGDLPVAVGPVSMRPAFNPDAPGLDQLDALGLPERVDPRQRSSFLAAWTLASIAHLAAAGVEAATYFDVVGWTGLFEREHGPLHPARFPSAPLERFPVLDVFEALRGLAGAPTLATHSSHPEAVVALALTTPAANKVLIANLTADEQAVTLQRGRDCQRLRLTAYAHHCVDLAAGP